MVFRLEFVEEEEALLAEFVPRLFGGLKLREEGLIRYGKAQKVVNGFLDVRVDFTRKIHCCCSKSKVGLRLRKKAMAPKPQNLRMACVVRIRKGLIEISIAVGRPKLNFDSR